MKIKGTYVAQVIINVETDDKNKSVKPFAVIKENVENRLTPALQRLIEEEADSSMTIHVIQQYANVYKEK